MLGKLALYSNQYSPETDHIDEALLRWLPRNASIGYLPSGPDPHRDWFNHQAPYYGRYGFTMTYFGLQEEFDDSRLPELFGSDAIHLTGGNTFQFLHWLRERGLIDRIRAYVHDGGVLIGASAGSIIMTPDVATAFLCGDEPYEGMSSGAAIGLVDFEMVPHYDGSEAQLHKLLNYSLRISLERGGDDLTRNAGTSEAVSVGWDGF